MNKANREMLIGSLSVQVLHKKGDQLLNRQLAQFASTRSKKSFPRGLRK